MWIHFNDIFTNEPIDVNILGMLQFALEILSWTKITKQPTVEKKLSSAFVVLVMFSLAVHPSGQTLSPKLLKMHLIILKRVS